MDTLWEMLLVSAVVILGLAGMAIGLIVVLKVMRQNSEYADRIMARDWPSYAGYVLNSPEMWNQRIQVMPEKRVKRPEPPTEPAFQEDAVDESDPNAVETVNLT
ncbi:hypothetical protein LCGC14_1051510 [marine sediment metagenome]|uniref:Uncharacterized protein n=1 Tax=marine sediment metagenome TaxID=412755 RepID=A0A0F9NAK1_9ZZZZ